MRIKIIRSAWVLSLFVFLSACSSGNNFILEPRNKEAADYNARLGAEYLRKNRLDLAEDKLSRALSQNPSSSEANHYYALLQNRLGDKTKANRHFQKAIWLDKDNPDIHNNYGSFLCQEGQYDQAVSEFKKALEDPLYKTPEYAYTNAGVCLRRANKLEEAEQYLREALKKNDKYAPALLEMAEIMAQNKTYAKAQAFLYRYDEMAPATAESLHLCYKVNESLQDKEEKERCRNALLSTYPDSDAAKDIQ